MNWDPAHYLAFEDFRTRPAVELLARVPHPDPRSVVDLGCGPGNSTRLLVDRWPDAHVVGLDTSPEMLERARVDLPGVAFEIADARTWTADPLVDVVFSNAVLQWIPDHVDLLPQLLEQVAPGGSLAIQVPNNFEHPAHAEGYRIVDESFPDLDGLLIRREVHSPAAHFDALAGPGVHVDVWETTYQQPLTGEDPVFHWTSSTFLRPVLEALGDDPTRRESFVEQYKDAMATAYPPRPDGITLLPFPRLFAVATKL